MLRSHRFFCFVIIFAGLSINSTTAIADQTNRDICPESLNEVESQTQTLADITCRAELSALKCDAFFETDQERKEFERKCPSSADAKTSAFDLSLVCAKQIVAPSIDSVKAVINFLAVGIKETSENRAKFIQECEKTPSFKSATARSIPIFSNWTAAQVSEIPCDYMVLELEETMAREKDDSSARVAEANYKKYISSVHAPAVPSDAVDPFSALIRHHQEKLRCVNQAGKIEMYCYGFFSVIDPTLLVGGIGAAAKGARLLKLFDKIGEAGGAAGKARGAVADSLTAGAKVSKVAAVKPPDLTKIKSTLGGEISISEKKGSKAGVSTLHLNQDGESVGNLTYAYDNGTLTIFNMDSDIQRSGIGTALVQQALADNPQTKLMAIETVAQSNRDVIREGLKEGLSLEDAIRKTPAYKIRASLGFSKFVSIDPDSFAFVVTRP